MSEHEHDWYLFTDGVFCKCGAEMPPTSEELKDELAAAQERIAELEEGHREYCMGLAEINVSLEAEIQRLREALEKCESQLPTLADLKGIGVDRGTSKEGRK